MDTSHPDNRGPYMDRPTSFNKKTSGQVVIRSYKRQTLQGSQKSNSLHKLQTPYEQCFAAVEMVRSNLRLNVHGKLSDRRTAS